MPKMTRTCRRCGQPFVRRISPVTVRRGHGWFCSTACSTAFHRTGRPSNNWRGGKHPDGNGYTLLYRPDDPLASASGYLKEHRLIASAAIGRPLRAREVVHHVNGDRTDNRPQNLVICTQAYHRLLHHLDNVRDEVICARY